MDEHGFSGEDAWVASDRESCGGAHRRKIVRNDMAAIWTPSILASLVGSVQSDVPDAAVIRGEACTQHVQIRSRRSFHLSPIRDIHPALV
jgi:uncharacterized protein (DUF2062 family)